MTREIVWHGILEDLLIRAYKIEALGEYLYQNQGLLDQETLDFKEYSDRVLTLIEDSEWHKQELEDFFEKMDLPILQFLFKNRKDLYKNYFKGAEISLDNIIPNLVRNENEMIDLYREIDKRLNEELIKKVWKDKKESDEFFSTMELLINSEKKHQDIITELLGNKKFLKSLDISKIRKASVAMDKIEEAKIGLNKDLSNGIRDSVFFESKKEVFKEILNRIEPEENVSLRSKNQINDKEIFEIEIRNPIYS